MKIQLLSLFLLPIFVGNAIASEEQQNLLSLSEIAQSENPILLSAESAANFATYKERESLGRLLPQASIEASRSFTEYSSNTTNYDYYGNRASLVINQSIINLPAWYDYKRSGSLKDKALNQTNATKQEQYKELITRYIDVLSAKDETLLIEKEIDTVKKNLIQVQKLLDKQLATVTDVLKTKSRLDALTAKRLESKTRSNVSQEALAELVGSKGFAPLAQLRDDAPLNHLIPTDSYEYWLELAQKNNPAIKQHEANIEAENAAYKGAISEHAPKLSFRLIGQSSNIGYNNIQTNDTDSNSATLQLQVPLFSGGSTTAAQFAAKERHLMAQQELKSIKRSINKELRSSYQNLLNAPERLNAAKAAVESAKAAKDAADKSFKYGLVNNIDVLERTEDEYNALHQQKQVRYDLVKIYTAFKFWTGSLSKLELEEINGFLF
jgi:outer membrane protein